MENFSDYLDEIRKQSAFKGSVVKFILDDEIKEQLANSMTTFEDESETSFFNTFGETPISGYIEQRVKLNDEEEGVYTVDHTPVRGPGSGVKTVKDFYSLAKTKRPFGFYDGCEEPLDGNFDAATVARLYDAFWKTCQSGRTEKDPFLYGVDIHKLPVEKLGPFEGLPLVKVI